MGKQLQQFNSREAGKVKVFTCGPSVYLRAHLGNYRTFLYEDILVRYLEYKGYEVTRAMNFTDIEDKAVEAANQAGLNVFAQTEPAKEQFLKDLQLLKAKKPIIINASDSINEIIKLIEILLAKGVAYNDKGSIFFDPLKFEQFGKLYGREKLMARWPKKRMQYKLDTYPGMRWNLGDFILWHKANNKNSAAAAVWDSPWGKGRPSWNVEDPAIIKQALGEQVDINCGGIDNIIRHHDYNIAIMEAASGKTYANFYLHGAHLYIDDKKMSKSLGNIYYPEDVVKQGYSGEDIRYFLTAVKHYRQRLNFTKANFAEAGSNLKNFKTLIKEALSNKSNQPSGLAGKLELAFSQNMDNDLAVAKAIKAMTLTLKQNKTIAANEEAKVITTLNKINTVLQLDLIKN